MQLFKLCTTEKSLFWKRNKLKLGNYFFFLISHRKVEAGRDLWRLSSPTSLLKVGSTRTGCSRPCPVRLCVSLRTETSHPRQDLFPGLTIITMRNLFSYVYVEFPAFQFVPTASYPFSGYNVTKQSDSVFFTCLHVGKISASIFFFRLNSHSVLSLSTYEVLQSISCLSGPSVDLLQYVHAIPGKPEQDPALQTWSH